MCTDHILSKLVYELRDCGYTIAFNKDYSKYILKTHRDFKKMWDMTPSWEGSLYINHEDKIILTIATENFFKNNPFKQLQYDISRLGYTLKLEHSIPSRAKILISYAYRWLEIYEVYGDI